MAQISHNKHLRARSSIFVSDIEMATKRAGSKWKFWKKNKNPNSDDRPAMDMIKDLKINEHMIEVHELCKQLNTSETGGLTQSEAEIRLKRDGPNAFTPPKLTPWWLLYLREISNGFALLLWFASIASFIAYGLERVAEDLYLAVVLVIVIMLTGTFSYYQQAKSSAAFKSFKNMAPPQTIVIREGKRREIAAEQVVVGDLVFCQSGDRVPADIRVVKSDSMKVDNSSLTGESDPLSRSVDVAQGNPLEARNLAFFSTNCVDGSGFGIVIATGDRTVMGDIARLVSNIKSEKTPIAKEVSRFSKIVTILAVLCGLAFFGISMGLGATFFNAFIFMIGITIGNVPEGLLPGMTVALTLTAKRMAKKQCLVKNLQSVETLGSTSTICTDKTGTLTQNRMTVEHCWLGYGIKKVYHEREDVEDQMSEVPNCWEAYKRCAILCSRSDFTDDNPDIMKRACFGDASETAILRFMESTAGPVSQYRAQYPKVAEKPFSSTYKYQYSIHKNTHSNGHCQDGSLSNFFLVMKGAPERIIKLCSYTMNKNGETVHIDSQFHDEFEATYRELGSNGERVLALCDHEFTQFPDNYKFNLDDGNDFELGSFRFLGLIAMIDPPRPTVPDAVAKCRSAGIKVVMVTGDHPITAQAIARSVGIFTNSHRKSTSISVLTIDKVMLNNRSIVVPGDDLAEMSDEDLQDVLQSFGEIVFARTSPQQKLRIVENFQKIGQIVAVTGDGVNDSPALKRADIGIAMGISGAEVSKQAADMILMDDNFATIVVGIEEGRRIFDNMKKVISYILSGNVATTWPFIIYVIFGFPQPIGTMTCLMIALGTDVIPAISLAYERAESDIMTLPPRNPKTQRMVTLSLFLRAYFQISLIVVAAGLFGYFITFYFEGFKPYMLWQLRHEWDLEDGTVYRYGPGDDWNGFPTYKTTYDERKDLLIKGQSSYFVAVIVAQWMDVIVSKTRRLSIFQQGMGNWVLNISIVIETALGIFFLYTPGLNTVLNVEPVRWQVWVAGLPFFLYMLVFEEFRKVIVRRYPTTFLGQELLA